MFFSTHRSCFCLFPLQGKLWKFGYEKGELKGEMFEDTPDAMAEWVAAGRRVAIFSSGSREAMILGGGFFVMFPFFFLCEVFLDVD